MLQKKKCKTKILCFTKDLTILISNKLHDDLISRFLFNKILSRDKSKSELRYILPDMFSTLM